VWGIFNELHFLKIEKKNPNILEKQSTPHPKGASKK
jgi:hypothetical protein